MGEMPLKTLGFVSMQAVHKHGVIPNIIVNCSVLISMLHSWIQLRRRVMHFVLLNLLMKSYGMTIQMKPLWQYHWFFTIFQNDIWDFFSFILIFGTLESE